MAKGSVENVLTVLRNLGIRTNEYDIHINFPGGAPIDGPSAGIAMAAAIFSAIHQIPIDHLTAMTGEIGLQGQVKPIGGVIPKIKAAKQAGATTVIIPYDNQQSILKEIEGVTIVPVKHFQEVLDQCLVNPPDEKKDGLEEEMKRKSV
ncbi:MAG: ATP-dependent protease LonB, partial [Bacillus sp. (in: Bacteria)]|jgi:ATP-dependent Lon protease|nr:ATP-dependent protease LonB [Bacillus sp. (in: firmicutes)]